MTRLLLLLPSIASYESVSGSELDVAVMTSGRTRRRKKRADPNTRINTSFTLNAKDFDYLMAFWRTTRATFFACRLLTDDSKLRWRLCRWESAPQISHRGAGSFTVSIPMVSGKILDIASLAWDKAPNHILENMNASVIPTHAFLYEIKPNKWASHPYPHHIHDDATSSVRPIGGELLKIYASREEREEYTSSVIPSGGELKQVFFYSSREATIEEYTSSVIPSGGELKQIFFLVEGNYLDNLNSSVEPIGGRLYEDG